MSKRYSISIYLKSVMRKEGSFPGCLEDTRSLRNSPCPSGADLLVTSWSKRSGAPADPCTVPALAGHRDTAVLSRTAPVPGFVESGRHGGTGRGILCGARHPTLRPRPARSDTHMCPLSMVPDPSASRGRELVGAGRPH